MKQKPESFDLNRAPGKRKSKRKMTLTFNEEKRREFLTGFHKRKLERKKKAKEELEKQLKDEKKQIKKDARERYHKLISKRDSEMTEIEKMISKTEYETNTHTVSVLEFDMLSGLGPNKEVNNKENSNDEGNGDNGDEDDESESEIPGMEMKTKKARGQQADIKANPLFSSRKELKQSLKQAALKQVQKSKAFKQKKTIERQKNKKLNKKNEIKKGKKQKDKRTLHKGKKRNLQ